MSELDRIAGMFDKVANMQKMTNDTLGFILDVLRANEMHEGTCEKFLTQQSQHDTDMYMVPRDCTCWLSKDKNE